MTASRFMALLRPAVFIKSLPILIALGISAFITYTFNSSLRQGHVMVEHSMNALAAMDNVLSLLKDAETGQRGFIITADESYLIPYTTARNGIEASLLSLDALVSKNAEQHEAVGRIRSIARRKLNELDLTIQVRRTSGLVQAASAVKGDAGKIDMDDLRREVDGMKSRERAILQDKVDGVKFKSEIIIVVSLLALVVSLIGRTVSSLIRLPGQFVQRSNTDA